jgi:hypothetical protein
MFCNYECVDAMTVGIPDFEIKIMVFRVMRAYTFVGGYQNFEGNIEAGSIFIFYPEGGGSKIPSKHW